MDQNLNNSFEENDSEQSSKIIECSVLEDSIENNENPDQYLTPNGDKISDFMIKNTICNSPFGKTLESYKSYQDQQNMCNLMK